MAPDTATHAVDPDVLGPMVPHMPGSPSQCIARGGLMLRVLVGSTVHGTAIAGTDDRDEMGITIEPPETVIGARRFETYTYRTQPEGMRSGPGDLDLTVHSLRKWVALAVKGNPTILLPLFVPDSGVLFETVHGADLRARRDMFLSRRVGVPFARYLESQRRGMLGDRTGSRSAGRADIRERYGFDTKMAGHMVRLGVQGVELLRTGTITLPIPEPDLTWIRDLRVGRHTITEALDRAAALVDELDMLTMSSTALPPDVDRAAIDDWLVRVHRRAWGWT